MQNTKRLVMVIVTVVVNMCSIQSAAQEDRSADQQERPDFSASESSASRENRKIGSQGRVDDSSAKYKAEIKKIDKRSFDRSVEKNQKILEDYFQDDVAEFIIQVHIEKSNLCSDYQNDRDRVPQRLKNKWVTEDSNGYCIANSESSRGQINVSICKDITLQKSRADQQKKYTSEDCVRALGEFRKNKKSSEKIQNEIDKLEEQNEREAFKNNDKSDLEEIKQKKTEANCEECAQAARGYAYNSSNNKSSQTQMVNQLMMALAYSLQMRNQYSNVQNLAQQGYPSSMGGMGSYGMGQMNMGYGYNQYSYNPYTYNNQYNSYSNYNLNGYSLNNYSGYSNPYGTSNSYSSYYNPYSSYYNSGLYNSGLGYSNYANYNYYNQYPYSTSGLAYSGTYYNNSGSPIFSPTSGYYSNGSYSTGNIYTSGR